MPCLSQEKPALLGYKIKKSDIFEAAMTHQEFLDSTQLDAPPQNIQGPLLALWLDRTGDWEKAHNTAQSLESEGGAWIHAYLHRKEGDALNAQYWYSRAAKPECRLSLDEEWTEITKAILSA